MSIEPKVEDLLASIRRSMDEKEEQTAPKPAASPNQPGGSLMRGALREMRAAFEKAENARNDAELSAKRLKNNLRSVPASTSPAKSEAARNDARPLSKTDVKPFAGILAGVPTARAQPATRQPTPAARSIPPPPDIRTAVEQEDYTDDVVYREPTLPSVMHAAPEIPTDYSAAMEVPLATYDEQIPYDEPSSYEDKPAYRETQRSEDPYQEAPLYEEQQPYDERPRYRGGNERVPPAIPPMPQFMRQQAPVVQSYQPKPPPFLRENKTSREHGALISPQTAQSAKNSFDHLAETILSRATSDRSLEDMTREMLRGMLRQWLDDNLPAIVEKLVREEIERVARRGH